jgi:hypothetical protein
MKLVVRLLAEGLQVRVLPGVLPMKTRSREPAVPPVRLVFSLLPSFAAARLCLLYAAGSTDAGMDKPKKKPIRRRSCQGVARREDPCERAAERRCSNCGLWFCRLHFPDPEWHTCAPDQGES